MSRETAAAKAIDATDPYRDPSGESWMHWLGESEAALSAADAHDAANGVHRVRLDDATVERAARAMFLGDNPDADWDRFIEKSFIKDQYRRKAKTVLAAAVKGDT